MQPWTVGNLPVRLAVKEKEGFVEVMNSRVFPNQEVRDIYFIQPITNRKAGHKVKIATLRERGDNALLRLESGVAGS